MAKYIDWKPGTHHMRDYDNPYTHAILELCNITAKSLSVLEIDDKWIKSIMCDILGISDYSTYYVPEETLYELD